jgi:hypothetical protein
MLLNRIFQMAVNAMREVAFVNDNATTMVTVWFRHAGLNAIVGFLLLTMVGCKPPAAERNGDYLPAEKPTGPAVALVIDFDDGLEKHYKLAADEPMTVLAALEAASKRERGIRYETKGSGEMAMVLSIDGLANEGGGKGRNWIYWVNGQLAEKSCGVYEVRPNDVILWKFGTYE